MKIGENVSVSSVVGDINYPKKEDITSSTIIGLEKTGGSELLEKSLEALAQGWADVKAFEKTPEPTLSTEQLKQKEKLEEKGLAVTVRPDGKFIVETETDKNAWLSSEDIRNVAVFKGNLSIYNGAPQSDVEYPNLESVEGDFTISGFDDECRTSGPNWGYACDVNFSNLKQVTGNINISNSACQLYLNSLEKVGGNLNIDASSHIDNIVFLNNIESIDGDFNIQAGSVHTTPQIFSAVEGTMNAIPPQSRWVNGFGTTLQVGEGDKAKYYEFTTEPEVIKKYTI